MIARLRNRLAHDKSAHGGGAALAVLVRNSVVAHFRGRHGQDLPCIGRIGERLLVAAHGGVEHHFASGGRCIRTKTKRMAMKDRSVLKCESAEGWLVWLNALDHGRVGL